ncbi:hypothetical protein EVAR_13165_1 [Eumeta japonica]|uniref:Uncharacterized protein n=1 Tax=Eumeta variegata TaxID=151549 RepID=A0A4C1UB49_EUMVA|nr:hypothetical protein EVAR_13165_1 [Eumeta japonica]
MQLIGLVFVVKEQQWVERVSTALEEIYTPALNNTPDIIETTDEINSAIGTFTNHIKTVIEKSSRVVPAYIDHRKLPADALEMLKAKNAALHHAYAYLTRENKTRARALQLSVKARIMQVKNEEWSYLMEDITLTHQAVTKCFKTKKKTVAVFSDVVKAFDRISSIFRCIAFRSSRRKTLSNEAYCRRSANERPLCSLRNKDEGSAARRQHVLAEEAGTGGRPAAPGGPGADNAFGAEQARAAAPVSGGARAGPATVPEFN